jgi:hypothetical protein
LALAITTYLDGDCASATHDKEELLLSVANFIPEGIFRHDRDGIEQLWQSVEAIAAIN